MPLSPTSIGLLLGAGASRPLGLPLMRDFIGPEYRTTLADPDQEIVFDIGMNWACAHQPSALDFELLYTAVDALARLELDDLISVAFVPHVNGRGMQYKGPTHVVPSPEWIRKCSADLRERLKAVVHDRVGNIDPKAAAALLVPLFNLIFKFSPGLMEIPVFTTNYDRAVESIWENDLQSGISGSPWLNRGFRQVSPHRGLELDLASYSTHPTSSTVVSLYKLHGGLNWLLDGNRVSESPANEYLKRNAVVYPLRKHSIEEPFKSLVHTFAERLTGLDILIVLGNSLRDEHLRVALIRAMEADSRFKVIVFDPGAATIIASFGDKYAESLFACPFPFGTAEGLDDLHLRLMEVSSYGSI